MTLRETRVTPMLRRWRGEGEEGLLSLRTCNRQACYVEHTIMSACLWSLLEECLVRRRERERREGEGARKSAVDPEALSIHRKT